MTAGSYASDRAPGAFEDNPVPSRSRFANSPSRRLRLHPIAGWSRPIWRCLALLLLPHLLRLPTTVLAVHDGPPGR